MYSIWLNKGPVAKKRCQGVVGGAWDGGWGWGRWVGVVGLAENKATQSNFARTWAELDNTQN